MPLKRTVFVARTAHDLKHVNTLHVPVFGVVKLYLSAGGKNSKSYLLPEAPQQKQASNAADTFCFAPEAEKSKIKYELDDVCGAITKAKLQLFHRAQKAPIWEKDLKDGDLAHGPHEIEWDGAIKKGGDFPEGFITVEHSPYKLKLTIQGEPDAHNYSPTAWTYFHILVHSIELEKGVKESLSRDLDKNLLDTWSIPADGKTQKVKLISNLFSTGSADKVDATSYTEYRDLWKDSGEEGPNLPIFAKLFVKNSSGDKKDVPKAIGKVRLLWDWRDSPEDLSIHFTQAKEFLEPALDYDKNVTKPKGDNCHKDRGGKRGDDTKPVFPTRPGYPEKAALDANKFPFKVDRCATRKWSSYSETWRTGKLMGKTGVSFQPSHMAGDAYLVDVYFAHNRRPDGKDDLDTEDNNQLQHAVKKSTGIWQIWREVQISLYHKKHASLPSLNIPTVATTLAKAYVELVDKSGAIQSPMAGYDTKIRVHLGGLSAERQASVKAGDQGTITKGGIKYVSYAAFKTAVKTLRGFTDPALAAWLTANSVASAADYKVFLEAIADNVVIKTCNEYFTASDGIKIFHLEPYWDADGGMKSDTGGFASTSFANNTRKKSGYIHGVLPPPPSIKEIASHEIGHQLFLPHAPGTARGPAAVHDQVAHWNNCMMSYEFDKEMKFCGLCLLRLRGWDHRVLNSDRTRNKK